jgi:hypothetical protein
MDSSGCCDEHALQAAGPDRPAGVGAVPGRDDLRGPPGRLGCQQGRGRRHRGAVRPSGRQRHRHRQLLRARRERAHRRRAGRPKRERWVLSTKYALTVRPDDPNGGGAHRKGLVQSLEASLRRLGTGYLDLYRQLRHAGLDRRPSGHPGRPARLEPRCRPAGALRPGRAQRRAAAAADGPGAGADRDRLVAAGWRPADRPLRHHLPADRQPPPPTAHT